MQAPPDETFDDLEFLGPNPPPVETPGEAFANLERFMAVLFRSKELPAPTPFPRLPHEEHGDYLRSHAWKVTREAALRHAGNRCQVCNGSAHLHVHHRTYERLGREHPSDLTVLCRKCHAIFHGKGRLAEDT